MAAQLSLIDEILDCIISSNRSGNSSKSDILKSLLPIIGDENKEYIINAINTVKHKNDIDQICYFLINKTKPQSTS